MFVNILFCVRICGFGNNFSGLLMLGHNHLNSGHKKCPVFGCSLKDVGFESSFLDYILTFVLEKISLSISLT